MHDVDVDGRRQRRRVNRRSVVEALADLYRDGNLDPSAAEVAERAGLSPRSLFRYFDDVDDLARAAIELQLERAAPFLTVTVAPEDDLEVRIAALARSRARMWEAVAPGARATRLRAWRHPLLASFLRRNRALQREQVRTILGPLDPMTLAAADVLCSFEAWELLRHDQRLGVARAEAALAGALRELVVS